MVVFLTSLRHPDNANNFAKVEELLSVTLHSLSKQTNDEFKVIVVCNALPNVDINDDRIHFHVVDFPAPSQKKASALDAEPKFKDKGTKYMSGLLYARQFSPDYVYIVDSDDWFNVNIVSTLKNEKKEPIWYIDKGYFVNYGLKEYKRKSGLSRYCGSTFIYDFDMLMKQANIQIEIDEHSDQNKLIEATSEFFLLKLMCNHTINYRHFSSIGLKPKALPLRAACWVQGTGENVSGTTGGESGLPIDQKFCSEFGLSTTFINSKSAPLTIKIREHLSSIRSSYDWLMSRISGTNRF